MTTRYSSSALVMELASEMKRGGVKAKVEWTPREFNREADALANVTAASSALIWKYAWNLALSSGTSWTELWLWVWKRRRRTSASSCADLSQIGRRSRNGASRRTG